MMFTLVVLGRSMLVVFGCSLVGGSFSVDALDVSPFEGVLDEPSRSWSTGLELESLELRHALFLRASSLASSSSLSSLSETKPVGIAITFRVVSFSSASQQKA